MAVDTETERIADDDPTTIPQLVVLTAMNVDRQTFLVHPGDAKEFVELHRQAALILHHAPFDRDVLLAATGTDLCEWLDAGRLFDTALLWQLVVLAEKGHLPQRWALDYLAEELLDVTLAKDDAVRLTFGQFIGPTGQVQPLTAFDKEHLDYAAADAVVTLHVADRLLRRAEEVATRHGISPGHRLSHDTQLRAAIALQEVGHNGMHLDQGRLMQFGTAVDQALAEAEATLREFNYWAGKGEQARYQAAVSALEEDLGVRLPRTPKSGQPTKKIEDLEEWRQHPFVDAFLSRQELVKLTSNYLLKFQGRDSVHPHFVPLVSTGRTACRNPNLQQLPRKAGIREAFVPSPGHLLLSADYKGIELCALAQEAYDRFGYSRMRQLINEGVDLHRWLAAEIADKPISEVTKEERQRAKAAGFGFPGGLGPRTFAIYARTRFGVNLGVDEAVELKERWFKAFPEMAAYMKSASGFAPHILDLLEHNPCDWPPCMMTGTTIRIIGGEPYGRDSGVPLSAGVGGVPLGGDRPD